MFCRAFPLVCMGAVDGKATLALLEEGERMTAAAGEWERKIEQNPGDLAGRLRLLAYYTGQAAPGARARHAVWLVENEPKAAIFELATRVYAIQPADEAGFQAMREAWKKQVAAHPEDA